MGLMRSSGGVQGMGCFFWGAVFPKKGGSVSLGVLA